MMRRLLVAATLSLLAPSAMAQTCLGIEWRVVQQTLGLDAAVGTQITTTQGAMLSLEELNRARLLSAFRVMTKQQAGSTDQQLLGEQQAAQATASAYAAQQQAYAVASAKDRYGAVGYGACAVGVKASSFYGAVENGPTVRAAIADRVLWKPNGYGDPGAWVKGPATSGPFDATTLFSGDQKKAGDYIAVVMGPPDVDPRGDPRSAADLGGRRLEKANRDALKSTSQFVMTSIAADYAADGPMARLRELTGHWMADDGGEAWAASMAAAPERGVLQDAVRIEAADLVRLAYSIKSSARAEAAQAALLLARINNALGRAPDGGGQ